MRSMRRHGISIFFALSALLFVGGLAVQSKHQNSAADVRPLTSYTPSPQPVGRHVLVIGDSFTGGSEHGGNGDDGWPRIVERELSSVEHPVYFDVSGRGGSGYTNTGPEHTTFVSEARRLIKDHLDVVVIFGSVNDLYSPGGVKPAVTKVLDIARNRASHAQILVIGPAWTQGSLTDGIKSAQSETREAAVEAGVQYVDPIGEGWFEGQPALIGGDRVHPNNAGHRYLAEKIAPLIQSLLAR